MSEVSSVVGERGSVSLKHRRVHKAFSPAPWNHALKFSSDALECQELTLRGYTLFNPLTLGELRALGGLEYPPAHIFTFTTWPLLTYPGHIKGFTEAGGGESNILLDENPDCISERCLQPQ